jgi:hypothetical protein
MRRQLWKTGTFALSTAALLAMVPVAWAGPIDPNSLPSIGTLSISGGSYTFNTNNDTLTGSNGVSFTGQTYNGIAVFDFSQVNISGGTFSVTGADPLAILSQGNISFTGGSIDLSGGNGSYSGGGVGVAGGGNGGIGEGDGPGGAYYGENGGGGFGGQGGSYDGGPTYGNLATQLVGGSGGGGSGIGTYGTAGGAGGGAIEVGATGSLTIDGGSILAAGGNGSPAEGGGGSGGGIFLHAESVNLSGIDALSVNGGNGVYGGGGGGGLILVEASSSYTSSGTDVFNLAPGGGSANHYQEPGAGVLTLDVATVPEPSSIVVLATAIPIAAAYLWRRRRRATPA